MNCPVCNSPMVVLLLSAICERCEARGRDTRGFIVWRSRPPGSCEYVFRTEPDVLRWRTAAGLDPHPIRRLVVPSGITWRESTGSVRGIWLGDGLYRVYPDRQSYESAENKEGALGQPPAGYMEPA